MDKIPFILGARYHIPFSAGDAAFEAAYRDHLKPFVSALYAYPKIPAALYYSGVVLQRLERYHPEFLMLIGDLVSRKQVELLGGGFYEPLMPLIPLPDRIGQIELFTTYLRKHFGKRPQGCMLPLLAWEPQLAGTLHACGMGYTFLDEAQFRKAGVSGGDLVPCITEDQGKTVAVFPILSGLGAAFENRRPSLGIENCLADFLENLGGQAVVSVFPRCPGWPNGHGGAESGEKAFHRFFDGLSAFESRFDFTHPAKFLKSAKSLKKAYFPCSLEEDALPVSPGNNLARQFLIACPEANGIYAKMLFTHVLINQLRGDPSRKRSARAELWKAQGYDSFCLTKDGGVSRLAVRGGAYRSLIEAEKITRGNHAFTPLLTHFDFDMDGQGEYLFQGERLNCYLTPEGARVFELDYLPKAWNYFNTVSPGGFADILAPPEGPECAEQRTRRCHEERFELAGLDKERGKISFRLPPNPALPYGDIEFEKTYRLKDDILDVCYSLRNRGGVSHLFSLAVGLDLSFPGAGLRLSAPWEQDVSDDLFIADTRELTLRDLKNEVFVKLESDNRFDAAIKAVKSPVFCQGVLQERYQSTRVMPIMRVSLAPEETCNTRLRLHIHP